MKHAQGEALPYGDKYKAWLKAMRSRVSAIKTGFYVTNLDPAQMWKGYIEALPMDVQQQHLPLLPALL